MSHAFCSELSQFFKLSTEEQSRPVKMTEGIRMTAEARAWWVRFQQERKEQREKQDTWRPKDWWGEPGRGGIGKTEGKGRGKGKGKGNGKGQCEEQVEMREILGGDDDDEDMEEDEEDGGVLLDEEPDYMAPEPRTPPQCYDEDDYY